jgi:hypothetical protein
MPTEAEYESVLNACRSLPPPSGNYHVNDYVLNLVSTVLDYQMNATTLANAENHFKRNRLPAIRTRDDLARVLATYSHDREGNIDAAIYLWGYKYGNRLQQLRELLAYFDSVGVTDQEGLRRWAMWSDFERDFKGRVKGLALAVYKWLVMRQGVETIKPDIHVKTFCVAQQVAHLPTRRLCLSLNVLRRTSIALRMNLIGAFGKLSATRPDLHQRRQITNRETLIAAACLLLT